MSPVRPRSPAPKSVLSAVHFSHNSAGQKQVSPAEARYPSGKGEVCKTFMRRFDPDPRLQIPQQPSNQSKRPGCQNGCQFDEFPSYRPSSTSTGLTENSAWISYPSSPLTKPHAAPAESSITRHN